MQAYIDFEIGEGNREGARELYERLLQRTQHVKVMLAAWPAGYWLDCLGRVWHEGGQAPQAREAPVCILQVWLSYAKFEATPLAVLATPPEEGEEEEEETRWERAGTAVAW